MVETESNTQIKYLELDEEVDEYWLFRLGLSILLGEPYQQTEQTEGNEPTDQELEDLEAVEAEVVWYLYMHVM